MEYPQQRQLGLKTMQHASSTSTKLVARIPSGSCCGARPSSAVRGGQRGGESAPSSRKPSRRSLFCRSALLGDGGPGDKGSDYRKRASMLKYVKECEPHDVAQFIDSAPAPVVAAMRQTVTNIIGSLPSQYFEVKVSTVADSLAQLFLTMARTGYLFASAQCRMELQSALNSSASMGSTSGSDSDTDREADQAGPLSSLSSLPSSSSSSSGMSSTSTSTSTSDWGLSRNLVRRDTSSDGVPGGRGTILLPGEEQYAPGVQKRNLEGEVLRWSYENGLERVEASKYVEHLEDQVATLKEMLLQVHEAHQQLQSQKAGHYDKQGASWGDGRAATATQAPSAIMSSLPGAATAAAAAAAAAANGSGALLEFLRGLPGDSLGELTSSMCPEVLDAMDAFVSRLMGTSDKDQLRSMSSEFNAAELSKVLLWLLVVGYALKTAEMRMDTMSGGGQSGLDKGFPSGLFAVKSKPASKGLWGGAFGAWGKLLPGS